MHKVSFLIESRDKIKGYFHLIPLTTLYYSKSFCQIGLTQYSNFTCLLSEEDHHLVAYLRNYSFEIGLVDFDEGRANGDFSYVRFDNPGDFTFFVVKSGVDFVGLHLHCDPWLNPLDLFLLLFPALVLLLEFLVKFLDVIHFFLIDWGVILYLPLKAIYSVQCRPFVVSIEAIDAKLQFFRNDHQFSLLLQPCQLFIKFLLFFHRILTLSLHPASERLLQLLLLLLALRFQLLLLGCIYEILSFIDSVDYLAVGWRADDLQVLDILEEKAKLCEIFPLRMVELEKFLFLNELVVQLLEVPGLSGILGLDELDEAPLKLAGGLLDVLQRVAGEVPNPHLVALGVEVALEAVLVLALLPAQLAEVLQPARRHQSTNNTIAPSHQSGHIMNNEIAEQQALAALRQDLSISAEELAKLLTDRKRLTERVEELNNRAVMCISNERWEQALVYLEAAEQLLESAAVRGHLTDRCLVQCILHNEASCYQNLWQLDQCSNYIEALIFNLNSRKTSASLPHNAVASREGKLGLAQYYLQFCAINSQLSNHSGALISARKSLCIIRGELAQWRAQLQEIRRPKGEIEEKLRLLHIVCRFNDNINLNLAQNLSEAARYYLKSWRMSVNSNKSILKEAREVIDNFNIKSVMALGKMTLADCINKYQNQSEMNISDIFESIFTLTTCYFTIATELRLISLKKSRERNLDKVEQPEYKQSEIYHLLSILLLALTLHSQCPFMAHLLLSFQNHYGSNLVGQEIPFRKVFAQIIFIKQERNFRDPSIEISEHEEALGSHLSKGSGTMIRKTKGSKESERENKFSLIDPKSKKSKLKNTKKEGKSKKEIPVSKSKYPRHSLSKSPNVKPNSKQSIIIKSQRSKESLHQRSPIPSIKLITHPSKTKIPHHNAKSSQKQKNVQKPKRKLKQEQNQNEYFLVRKKSQKKQKKTSVSSKKNSSQPRSTGRLPIDSTLETKDNQLITEKKKSAKRCILQHYL